MSARHVLGPRVRAMCKPATALSVSINTIRVENSNMCVCIAEGILCAFVTWHADGSIVVCRCDVSVSAHLTKSIDLRRKSTR